MIDVGGRVRTHTETRETDTVFGISISNTRNTGGKNAALEVKVTL